MTPFRITHGSLFADILVDRRGPYDIWIYVVQRQSSPEVLAMGSCNSEEEARSAATSAMRQFGSRAKKETA